MPIVAYLAEGSELLGWLWRNRTEVGPYVEGVLDRVLARDGTSVDRIGAVLVAQREGHTEVIGLLQDVSGKADSIQAGIGVLEVGQQALGNTLSVLQNLSMVGLGVTALSQIYLWRQFTRLNRRLDDLGKSVEQIKLMIHAQHRAGIETGLTQLRHGSEADAEDKPSLAEKYLTDAFNNLATGANNFTAQMGAELEKKAARVHLRLLAQWMTVAVLGEAGCQVALGKGVEAARAIEGRLPTLRAFARQVFEETAGRDPTRFLIPAMAEHGVTLDFMAQLFRQAAQAEIIDKKPGRGASDFFEFLRTDVFRVKDPVFRKERSVSHLRGELAEAVSAVEDLNRVQSLAMAIRAFDRPECSFRDLAERLGRQITACMGTDPAHCFVYIPEPGRFDERHEPGPNR